MTVIGNEKYKQIQKRITNEMKEKSGRLRREMRERKRRENINVFKAKKTEII